jgi:hypothetical protein
MPATIPEATLPLYLMVQLQQGFAAGETGFRDQVARQHFLPAHVRFGSKDGVIGRQLVDS